MSMVFFRGDEKMSLHYPCTVCGTQDPRGQWWSLNNYFGLRGWFCPKCYDKIAHDSYGKPNHPEEYRRIRKLLSGEE